YSHAPGRSTNPAPPLPLMAPDIPVSHSGSAALGTKGGPAFPSPHGGNRTMARGRRGKRRSSRRDKRSHHNRTRRALSPAVLLAAVPVGLALAAALIIVTEKGIDPGATEGRIGESITSAVPDAATDEDFFADPTQGPDDSAPSGDNDAQDAQVTASSAPDDENADEEDNGSADGDGGRSEEHT